MEVTYLKRTARRPPKAPDTVAAEKKIAARIPNSDLLYQLKGLLTQAGVASHAETHHDR